MGHHNDTLVSMPYLQSFTIHQVFLHTVMLLLVFSKRTRVEIAVWSILAVENGYIASCKHEPRDWLLRGPGAVISSYPQYIAL